jgi:hypothetical protein
MKRPSIPRFGGCVNEVAARRRGDASRQVPLCRHGFDFIQKLGQTHLLASGFTGGSNALTGIPILDFRFWIYSETCASSSPCSSGDESPDYKATLAEASF